MSGWVRISATIREEQREWLEKHPEINVSGLLQKAIDELMKIMEGFEDRLDERIINEII